MVLQSCIDCLYETQISSVTKVYDNFVCVRKGEQAIDVKRMKIDEPISVLSNLYLDSVKKH